MKYELYRILFYKSLKIDPIEHKEIIEWKNVYQDKNYNNDNFINYFFIRNLALAFDLQNSRSDNILQIKYELINNFLQNSFYSDKTKENLIELNGKCFKYMVAFQKFYSILAFKQPPKISIDLNLNPIDLSMKNVILIREQKSNYLFRLSDILNISINNLTEHDHFFLQIKTLTNPYTNLPFSIHNMYNIYFAIKESKYPFCLLFHNFFKCNFCIKCFKMDNEFLIKDEVIKRFVMYGHISDLNKEIKYMISANKFTKKWNLSDEFPPDQLVRIFRPLLKLRLFCLLGPSECEKYQVSKNKLDFYLYQMYKSNTTFGRKIIRLRPKRIEFITKCCSFDELEKIHSDKDFSNSLTSSITNIIDAYNFVSQLSNLSSLRFPTTHAQPSSIVNFNDIPMNLIFPHYNYEVNFNETDYNSDNDIVNHDTNINSSEYSYSVIRTESSLEEDLVYNDQDEEENDCNSNLEDESSMTDSQFSSELSELNGNNGENQINENKPINNK